MERREGFTLIELMIVVVIIGILASIAIPNYIQMQLNAREAHVKSDVHTVQLAAEDWGVLNEGRYSDAAADLTPLLPQGALMENVFTDAVTEPQFGVAATTPGQIGIVVQLVGGLPSAYTITGYGRNSIVLTRRGGQ